MVLMNPHGIGAGHAGVTPPPQNGTPGGGKATWTAGSPKHGPPVMQLWKTSGGTIAPVHACIMGIAQAPFA